MKRKFVYVEDATRSGSLLRVLEEADALDLQGADLGALDDDDHEGLLDAMGKGPWWEIKRIKVRKIEVDPLGLFGSTYEYHLTVWAQE